MDHLKSSEERRARWYSKLQPRFVPVQPARDWGELLQFKNEQHDNHHPYYNVVKSVPMQWLMLQEDDDHHTLPLVHSKLQEVLRHHGFLVISNVVSDSECEGALRLAADWVEAVSCAVENHAKAQQKQSPPNDTGEIMAKNDDDNDGPSQNLARNKRFPKSIEGGIIPFYGSGHSSFAWSIRSHPNVIRVFQCIWGEDEPLIASLDGIVLWQSQHPPTDAGWFHVDQNPRCKPGFESVQGLVNLLPVTPSTGGNALVPQSHHLFPHHYTGGANNSISRSSDAFPSSPCLQFYRDRLEELKGDDWMEIDPNDSTILSSPDNDDNNNNKSNIISCLLAPGDLLLWDSRLVHCSYPGSNPTASRDNENGETIGSSTTTISNNHVGLCRAATVVSMMPQSKCSLDVLQQRRQAVDSARTLTHWANKVAPLGNEHATNDSAREEAELVAMMKKHQAAAGRKVLLDFEDLNATQQKLVVGNLYNKKPA